MAYIFQRGFLVGLYFVLLIFERLNFQMWRLRKELVKLRLLRELTDTNLSYLSKYEEDKK